MRHRPSLATRLALWWVHLPQTELTVGRSSRRVQAWVHFWDRLFRRVGYAWREGVRPHLMPRRYAREHYDFWVYWRLPEHVEGYVWSTEPEYGWVGIFRHADGPTAGSELCCFQGDTEEQCKDEILEHVKWCEKEAGKHGKSWEIAWFNHEPPKRNLNGEE